MHRYTLTNMPASLKKKTVDVFLRFKHFNDLTASTNRLNFDQYKKRYNQRRVF